MQEYIEFREIESLDDIVRLFIHIFPVIAFFLVIIIIHIPFNRYGDIGNTGTEMADSPAR